MSASQEAMHKISQARAAQKITVDDLVQELHAYDVHMTYHQYAACEDGRTRKILFDMIIACAEILDLDNETILPSRSNSSCARPSSQPTEPTEPEMTGLEMFERKLSKHQKDRWLAAGNSPEDYAGESIPNKPLKG